MRRLHEGLPHVFASLAIALSLLAALAMSRTAYADDCTYCTWNCMDCEQFNPGDPVQYGLCQQQCGTQLPQNCPNPTDDPCPNYTNSTDCFLGTCTAANGACPCLWAVYQYYCYCPT